MIHFINNFTSYIMVDAIESTWKDFQEDFNKSEDFASIIEKHNQFVENVLEKALLTEENT